MERRRIPVLNLSERRSWWMGFAAQAVSYAADMERAGDGPVDRQARAVFAHEVARGKVTPFPLPYASALSARDALLCACGGLLRAEREAERGVMARLTEACARGVDQLLEIETLAQVETWKRRIGED